MGLYLPNRGISPTLPMFVLAVVAGFATQDYSPLAVFAVALFAWAMAWRVSSSGNDSLDYALLGLAAYSSIHPLFVGDTPALAAVQAASLATFSLAAYALRRVDRSTTLAALVFLAAAGAVLGLVAVFQWTHGHLPRSLFLDINSHAAFAFASVAAALAAAALARRRGVRVFAGVTLLAAAASWLLARSKGSTLSLAIVALLVLPLVLSRFRTRRQAAAVAAVAWALILAAVAAALLKYDTGLGGLWSTQSIQSRIGMWEKSIEMIRAAPLTGHGLANWQHLYHLNWSPRDTESYGAWAHNDYLQLAAEGGIPLLLLLAGVLFFATRQAWVRRARLSLPQAALLIGFAVFALHAAVNFIYCNALLAFTMGAMLGMALPAQPSAQRARRNRAAALTLLFAMPTFLLTGWVGLGEVVSDALVRPASWSATVLRPHLNDAMVEATTGLQNRYLANPYAAVAVADTHVLAAATALKRGDQDKADEHARRTTHLYRTARAMAPLHTALMHNEAMAYLNLQQLGLLPKDLATATATHAATSLDRTLWGKPWAADIRARLLFIDGHCNEAVAHLQAQAQRTQHWTWRQRLNLSAKALSSRCASSRSLPAPGSPTP